ncbi:MAG TPA: tRNA uridine-5-carboxymethylaminomethyl(34) synthesis GTPase MnmE [Bacteroidaceae bacterium]|nr:tRNA uridine-5-carboxymethylaminomethyl(34) synthesis GTPase MnmE [Bacteroidaceae bacterium]
MILNNDTICAIATSMGGALCIIRVSGPEAISITGKLFLPKKGKPFGELDANSVTFGNFFSIDGELIDQTLVTLFRAPISYTGQDSVEISCHGSTYIAQQILQALIDSGCRQAGPGEYTQRAFLNGKIDLSQAEAVADLIASTSAGSHRLALNQMRGHFSRQLKDLREQLLNFSTLIELELDFSEEDLDFADRKELLDLADKLEKIISDLVDSFQTANAIKNGIPVVIIGQTNTGKSTLLNLLLKDDKAIVSDIQGTTRDSIEDTIIIGGILFRFIDTAGLRETSDVVESIGIARSYRKIEEADIVLWVIDSSAPPQEANSLESTIIPLCKGKHLIRVYNKSDKLNSIPPNISDTDIYISAKKHINIDGLQNMLIKAANIPAIDSSSVVVTNIRHYQALKEALSSIRRVQQGIPQNLSADFLSQDIREAIFHLSDIIGEVSSDSILKNIFDKFCIGK